MLISFSSDPPAEENCPGLSRHRGRLGRPGASGGCLFGLGRLLGGGIFGATRATRRGADDVESRRTRRGDAPRIDRETRGEEHGGRRARVCGEDVVAGRGRRNAPGRVGTRRQRTARGDGARDLKGCVWLDTCYIVVSRSARRVGGAAGAAAGARRRAAKRAGTATGRTDGG